MRVAVFMLRVQQPRCCGNANRGNEMACIDIYEPVSMNNSISSEKSAQRVRGKQFLATEVYDFLLQVDDDRPLDSFFIGSPHFCRTKGSGGWIDRVRLLGIGGAQTTWGWFYSNEHRRPNDEHLILQVPSATDPTGPETIELDGLDLVPKQIDWFDGLQSDTNIELMRDLKKSLYRVTLGKSLKPYGTTRMWFRLLVEPAVLDVFPAIPGTLQSIADLTSRALTLTTSVSGLPLECTAVAIY